QLGLGLRGGLRRARLVAAGADRQQRQGAGQGADAADVGHRSQHAFWRSWTDSDPQSNTLQSLEVKGAASGSISSVAFPTIGRPPATAPGVGKLPAGRVKMAKRPSLP